MQSRDGKDYLEYAKARNQAKGACRQATRDYEKSVARQAKQNPKALYAYVNSKMKTREGIADLVDGCGSRVSSDSPKAEILNNFFCRAFTKENMENVPECKKKQCHTSLDSVEFTKGSVLKKLQNLNPGKLPGPDGFHSRILKELAEKPAEPIARFLISHWLRGNSQNPGKMQMLFHFLRKGTKANLEIIVQSA